jgi:gamma-tubulin complex component 4
MADWAASALHKLVMVDSSFQSHLTVLCDYFFLQDGFFYRTLLSLASGLLELTPGINAEHDMNVFFQESAAAKQFLGETGDATSSLFQNLKLTFSPSYIDQSMLPSSSTSSKGSIGKVWRDLCLDYSTSWPLNLILSPPTLRQYNEIFQFLFHVKRIQIGLQNGWKLSKQPVDPAFIRIMHRFQMLRHQMGFFIDTLSQYLHVDVFSSEIQTLDSKIRNCNNFEDLLVAHQHFLSQVLLQCFLSVPAFKRAFAVLFDTIGSFTGLLRELASASQGDSTQNTSLKEQTELNLVTIQKLTEELETMMKEWFKHTSLLFTLLSGVKGQAPHLHHLLLLLDYSLFFSEEKSLLDLEKTHQDELPLATAHMALKHSIPISSQHGWVDTHASEQSLRSNPYKSQHSFRRLSPVPDSSDASTASSSAASSSRGTSSSSSHPKLSTAKRSRAASAEAPSVSEPPTKASSGPRPELLARLMRKSNK